MFQQSIFKNQINLKQRSNEELLKQKLYKWFAVVKFEEREDTTKIKTSRRKR